MQISAVSAVGAIGAIDRQTSLQTGLGARALPGTEAKNGDEANKAADAAKADPARKERVPFEPAPAIRPTVQDTVDIDRALLQLRQG